MTELLYIIAVSLGVLALVSRLLPFHLRYLVSTREYGALIILPTFGTISPNYATFALLVLGFMSFVPASPEQRLRLLIFCLPLLPSLSLILKAPPPINQLIRVDYNLLLILGSVPVLSRLRRISPDVQFRRWDVLMVGLFAALWLSVAKGSSFTNMLRTSLQLGLFTLLPYFMFSRGTAFIQAHTRLLLQLVLAAVIVAGITMFEGQRHWLLYDSMNSRFGAVDTISAYAKQRGGYLRASTTFPESTSLSLFIGLVTVMWVALRHTTASRLAFWAVLLLLLMGQLFTFARVGMFTTAVGFVALLIFERRYFLLTAAVIAAPMAWLGLASVARHATLLAASFGLTEDATGTVDYRSMLADRIFQEIARSPWLGLTSDQIQVRLADLRQGEGIIDLVNTPLTIALQSGLVGLVMFLAPSVALIWCLRGLRRSPDDEVRSAGAAVFCGLLALHAGLLTTSLLPRNQLWMIFLLGLGAGLCARAKCSATRLAKAKRADGSGNALPEVGAFSHNNPSLFAAGK